MIVKQILVTKPRMRISNNGMVYVPPDSMRKVKIQTTYDLNKFHEDQDIKEDDFLTFVNNSSSFTLFQIIVCIAVIKDIESIIWDRRGHPLTMVVVGCGAATGGGIPPYLRFESMMEYRKLNEKELEEFIKPHHDKLQNYISEQRKEYTEKSDAIRNRSAY